MSITFVGGTNVLNDSAWPNTLIPRPAGINQGDHMVAFLALIGQPSATTEPAGWTLLGTRDAGNFLRTRVYLRVAGSSEPSAGYLWEWDASFKNLGVILVYRGLSALSPLSFSAASGEEGTGHDTPQVDLSSGGWLLSLVAGRHDGTPQRTWTSSEGGDSERFDDGSAASGKNITGAVYDSGEITTPGSYQRTLTSSATVSLVAVWSLALRATEPAGTALPWVVGQAAGTPGAGEVADIGFVAQADQLDEDNALNAVTVDVPAGVVDGQWMVAHISAAADVAITAPAGWTQIGAERHDGNLTTAVWHRTASSEPADYTWTLDGFTRVAGRIVAYSNVDTSDPVADNAVDGTTTSTTSIAMPSVTMPENGWLLILPADRRNSPSDPQVWSSSDASDVKRGEVSGATGSSLQTSSAAIDSDRALSAGTPTRTIAAAHTWGQVTVWAIAVRRDG